MMAWRRMGDVVDPSGSLTMRWESDVNPTSADAISATGPLSTMAPSGRESQVGIRTRDRQLPQVTVLQGRRGEESGRPRTPGCKEE